MRPRQHLTSCFRVSTCSLTPLTSRLHQLHHPDVRTRYAEPADFTMELILATSRCRHVDADARTDTQTHKHGG